MASVMREVSAMEAMCVCKRGTLASRCESAEEALELGVEGGQLVQVGSEAVPMGVER